MSKTFKIGEYEIVAEGNKVWVGCQEFDRKEFVETCTDISNNLDPSAGIPEIIAGRIYKMKRCSTSCYSIVMVARYSHGFNLMWLSPAPAGRFANSRFLSLEKLVDIIENFECFEEVEFDRYYWDKFLK